MFTVFSISLGITQQLILQEGDSCIHAILQFKLFANLKHIATPAQKTTNYPPKGLSDLLLTELGALLTRWEFFFRVVRFYH